MKPFDDEGRELDAIFSVQWAEDGTRVILESRGGAAEGPRAPRNAQYAEGLELLLRRMGEHGATLVDVEVYSRETQNLPIEQRRIAAPDFPFPIDLRTLDNPTALRKQLGRASAALGRREGQKGGNPTKRLRLTVVWPGIQGDPVRDVEKLLARLPQYEEASSGLFYDALGNYLRGRTEAEITLKFSEIEKLIKRRLPDGAWRPDFWANTANHHTTRRGQWLNAGYHAFLQARTESVLFRRQVPVASGRTPAEAPTGDPSELQKRIAAAVAAIEAEGSELPPAPPGSVAPDREPATTSRFIRDPNVIAWVLCVADGTCEVCDAPAPFARDNGTPFLEVHHLFPLAEGGPDVTQNAVAACPNCHRRLHFGSDRDQLRLSVIAKVPRLSDFAIGGAKTAE